MDYLTTNDIAKELGIGRRRVIQLAQSRKLGKQLSSGAWIFTKSDLDKMRTRSIGRPGKEPESDLTKEEFEALLTKASQPLGLSQQPDQEGKGKSVENPSYDCNDSHIHPDNSVNT